MDVLSKKGYVVRENDEKDRRSSCINLTDAGRKMFDDLIPCVELNNEQFRKGISDES